MLNIKAYITHPVRQFTLHNVLGQEMISWVIRQAFTREDTQSLTEEKESKFAEAIKYIHQHFPRLEPKQDGKLRFFHTANLLIVDSDDREAGFNDTCLRKYVHELRVH